MVYYIAAVPLFNSHMEVESYFLKCQDTDKIFGISYSHVQMDGVMNSPSIEMLNSIGAEPLTGGKPIFIELNRFGLLTEVYRRCKVPHESMVYVLSDSIPAEAVYLEKCVDLKRAGCALAVSKMEYSPDNAAIFALADYVVFSANEKDYMEKQRIMRLRYPKIKVVLTDVADILLYEASRMIPNALFGGGFYTQPLTRGVKEVNPLKSNALHLLKLVGEDDFDLEDASKIIRQDTALALALLRFINSPAIGLKGRVNSIQNAVALLGQKETKKWVMVAVSTYIAADKPNEITRLSLVRAKFAEELATLFEMGIHAQSLFLMGLFSLLDVILEKPMDKAISEISVNDNIKQALVNKEGPFKDVLELIYGYEHAEWRNVHYIAITRNISVDRLNKAFIDSLIWYKQLLDSME